MQIVPFAADLAAGILAMQAAAAPGRAWSEDDLAAFLLDRTHGGGAQVAVAIDDRGAVAGVAGWVTIGIERGDFYGAPVIAPGIEAAALLVARTIAEAKRAGAAWIRIAARDDEQSKRSALTAAGFRHAFDFVDVARPLGADLDPPGPVPADLRPVAPDPARDLAGHVALYNACFAEVPNAPPIDRALAAEEWSRDAVDRAASLTLVDRRGRDRAFVMVTRDGCIETIGVDAGLRGRAVGRWLLDRALHLLARSGVSTATARIASSNAASLGLFAGAGFTEAARLPIYQRDLALRAARR
jgi:ribosomal protein S18 acetylase RimI-like enzyme